MKKAHLLRWRPRPHAQRTGSTPRVRLSGAASHLDLFEQPASGGETDGQGLVAAHVEVLAVAQLRRHELERLELGEERGEGHARFEEGQLGADAAVVAGAALLGRVDRSREPLLYRAGRRKSNPAVAPWYDQPVFSGIDDHQAGE